ncbi:MAG: hypothetical protein OXR03_11280 [Rhodospirillaceae bacterium]|nr:hypothetical protein [Rhodospirillaceae bacterium]
MRRVRRRPIVLLAALALGLQAMFATGLQAAIEVDSGVIRIVTLCTGEGFQRITLDRENRPVSPRHDHEECPECVLACANAAALVSEAAYKFPPAVRQAGQFNLAHNEVASSPVQRPFGRAPPHSGRSIT